MFLVGLVFFIPAVVILFKTGEIKVPSIILSMLLFVCTLQSLFTGLTLDNIIRDSRQNFEMRLIDCENQLKRRKED
jgi:branched-subunit amino acid transport protein